jgi:hypothetical protein
VIRGRLDRAASYYSDGEVVGIETLVANHTGDIGYALRSRDSERASVIGRRSRKSR